MFDIIDVSIIMPCFNGSGTLRQAIDSVVCQDYENFELIIIDDNSTDNSLAIALSYAEHDSRIVVIRNCYEVKGVSHARNSGIKISRGRYICFLDSDDYLVHDSLKLRLDFLKHSEIPIVFGSYLRLERNSQLRPVLVRRDITMNDMLRRNMIGNLTGMYDSQRLPKLLQRDIRHEDYLMWCELVKMSGKAKFIPDCYIGVYRISSNSLSGNKIRSAFWHWSILRHGLGLNLLMSIFFQTLYIFDSLRGRFFLI